MDRSRDAALAEYSDGRTAARHAVRLTLLNDGIKIWGDGVDAYWPLDGLSVLDAPDNQFGIRLGHKNFDGARLTLATALLIGQFHEQYPAFMKRRQDGRRADLRKAAWASGVMVVLAAGFFLLLPNIVGLITALIPYSVEKKIGDSAMNSFGLMLDGADQRCTNPEGAAALAKITGHLQQDFEASVPVTVQVTPSEMVNAVAFPGGSVLIFDGLIQQAGSAEEVAGVIAHEIGHAHHRHGMERMVRDSAIEAVVSIFAPGAAGDLGAGLGSTLLAQSYGREAEAEADRFAVARLNAIGVSSDGMADFFDRMQKKHGSSGEGLLRYLASHPLSVERAQSIRSGGTGSGTILTAEEWEALKSICGDSE